MHRRLGDNGLFAAAVLSSRRGARRRGSRENIALRRAMTRAHTHRHHQGGPAISAGRRSLDRSIHPSALCRCSDVRSHRAAIYFLYVAALDAKAVQVFDCTPWKRLLRKRFRKLRIFFFFFVSLRTCRVGRCVVSFYCDYMWGRSRGKFRRIQLRSGLIS